MPPSVNKVKKLDDMSMPPLLDHVGWRLYQAAQLWESRFRSEMIAAGHSWFAEARAALIPHLDRAGTPQKDLAEKPARTKQAIKQVVDALEQDGILERYTDPADARARMLRFTRAGMRVLESANAVKRRIEKEYKKALGADRFAQLSEALGVLI